MDTQEYQVKMLEDASGRCPFEQWYAGLKDKQARARVSARGVRLQAGNFGDCKPVGGGVSELRVDYGPGYRVYFATHKDIVIVLLGGGDKSTQQADITRAVALWEANRDAVERFQRDFQG